MANEAVYLTLKLVHVLSAVFLLGHWTLLAAWKASADRSGDPRLVASVMDRVFRLNRKVTAPVALVAFAAGYVIIRPLGMFGGRIALNGWALWGLFLFFGALALWFLGMRPLEARLADLADEAAAKSAPPSDAYRRATVAWLAAIAMAVLLGLVAAALMVFKPTLWPSG